MSALFCRFNMSLRVRHLNPVKSILCYLKLLRKGRLIIDTAYPDHSIYPVEDHTNWMEFYPDTEKEIPNDLPASKGPKVRITVYVDADCAHDLITNISITPVRLVSKRKKIVETST
jgi:hypothetical protein